MADRERSRDRPVGQPSSSSSSSTFGGGRSFLPNLFGRLTNPSKAPAKTDRTEAATDDILSPRSVAAALPALQAAAGPDTRPSVPPFDIESALSLMEPGATKTTAELCELVKATSVWLANLLVQKDDVFSALDEGSGSEAVRINDLRTLYIRAYHFANPKSDYALRTAAIRLLAALLATVPPPVSPLDDSPLDLPHNITSRSLYALITSSSGGQPGTAQNDQILVEVGALRALTRNGEFVDGMEGIVGWLLKVLGKLKADWLAWCSKRDDFGLPEDGRGKPQPFGSIRPATPAEAVAGIIDLLLAIITHHLGLFTTGNLATILRALLDFFWAGMLALQAEPTHRVSPASTAVNLPAVAGLGLDTNLKRATSITRSRKETSSTIGSPHITPRSTRQSISALALSPHSPTTLGSPTRMQHLPPRWSRAIPPLCTLITSYLTESSIKDDLFDELLEFLCFAFGQDDADGMIDTAWTAAYELALEMLSTKTGRRGELSLRRLLEGKLSARTEGRKEIDVERKITRGAVVVARSSMQHLDRLPQALHATSLSLARLAPSLVAAQSTTRFPGDSRVADWTSWQPVDVEVLCLLQEHLGYLLAGKADDAAIDDEWTEGEAACQILDGMVSVVLHVKIEAITAIFDAIVHQLPSSIGRLHSSTSTTPTFYHPKYIDLLLDLSSRLSEDDANVVIDFYQRECLCLPFTTGWIKNTWRLLEAFAALPAARLRVLHMLFGDIYGYVEILPEHRTQLVAQVVVPHLEQTLCDEYTDDALKLALSVLISAAVAETTEKDEQRRRVRATKAATEVEAEDAAALPSQEVQDAAAGGSFDAIRALIIKLATETACTAPGLHGSASTNAFALVASQSSTFVEGVSTDRPQATSSLRSIMSAISPPTRTKELPSLAEHGTGLSIQSGLDDSPVQTPGATASPAHTDCRSLQAIAALIAIFTRLTFAPPHAIEPGARATRTPASSRSITIYRDLLDLLFPMADGAMAKVPARCPRARVLILQWLFRLRADRKHRIYFRADINRFIMPFAANLYRTKETEATVRTELDDARKRSRQAPVMPGRPDEEPRGRSARAAVTDAATRSRSRSKPAPMFRGADAPTKYNPLWSLPETLACELPPDLQPSEGMTTYDPNHPSLRELDAPPVEGVWLPVSEYVRVLNGLLRWEHDWELVSYVLCFIPLQLGNKYFFHGRRATHEVKALLHVLCDGVLATENRWERRFHVPPFIKRTHINAAAYASISILMSYRGVLDRSECDKLVQSLIAGLEASPMLARPSLQALTLGIFELEQYVGKHLLTIIQRMEQILLAPAIAVHILEFLQALGQNANLYRNFTEDQYRLVFAVAIGYIAEHNARSDQPLDLATSREALTLSQHVIGLAYHTVYVWFMALRVAQRPKHVAEIVRGLISAKSQRQPVDERTEVCFDWLARYTYGNADPRPATSFLTDAVTRDDRESKSQSWLLGGAVVTVQAHTRTGWATISTTRPTGSTAVVCKLENVPLLELGEADADLASLPAFLMADRERRLAPPVEAKQDASGEPDAGSDGESKADAKPTTLTDETRAIVDVGSTVAYPAQGFDTSSLQGFIWSGATPSQRRKDVTIEPSYLALQLLAAYPNASLDTPRGRPIPKDAKFDRALRGIENTPMIDTLKIGVLYVGPGQKTETEIFGNVDGSPLYLDFLSGLGRIIRLKGQVDVFTGGLDREDDGDGPYAYAWWDDLHQIIFHAPTMMPNRAGEPEHAPKKRLVGNDIVKIVYNESGADFAFDTVRTAFNFVNIVISPHATGEGGGVASALLSASTPLRPPAHHEWADDGEDYFKVVVQRAPGIPDFSPIGEHKLVSRRTLPVLVRQVAHHAHDLAARFMHIRQATDADSAEYITSWRSRYRAINRIRDMLPPTEVPADQRAREELLRDFTKTFSLVE
ncbi:Tuberous sclerosis 2-like protein [Cryptotrichosporon argae]